MNTERPVKKCSESRVVRTNRIFPNDLNNNNTLFGGTILSLIDISASISVARHTRKAAVTASMDSVDFINAASLDDSICAETFISGVGNSSVEVFCKVIAENLMTGERRLCATAFTTFTCFNEDGSPALVPLIEPETEEEKYIHAGYPARRKKRLEDRELSLEIQRNISMDIPWVTKRP
ncbi:MAG: acyl-CoA thioesterase [Clostridiales bacterium]|nr:acyl-CoA thioesterase [Clostridiales bacterium]